MSTIIYVTEFGYAQLKGKLDSYFEDRKTVQEQMSDAMENTGELSENSEFLTAKTELDRVESKIQETQNKLQNCKIIYKVDITNDEVVRFGKTVVIRDADTEKLFEYTIVGIDESDLKLNKVSHLSPIGKALLKQSKGDYVYFETPNGDRELEILEVKVPN